MKVIVVLILNGYFRNREGNGLFNVKNLVVESVIGVGSTKKRCLVITCKQARTFVPSSEVGLGGGSSTKKCFWVP